MGTENEPQILAAQDRRGMEERLWLTLGALGVARWTRSLDGAFHDPQPSWSKLTGQTQSELAGFGWLDAIHPNDRDRVRSHWAQGAKDVVLGYRLRDAMGTWREIEERTARFDGSDGLPPQALGIIEDVGALHRAQQRLRLALDGGKMGTWDIDLSTGTMECSNQCKLNYGRSPVAEFTYEDLAASVYPDDFERWRAAVAQAMESGGEFDIDYRTVWPDGSIHWVYVRGGCALDNEGRASTLSGVSIDVTDRKLAEETLRLQTARQAFQLAFADRIRPLADPDEVIAVASELLGKHLGVARVVYAAADQSGETVSINRDWTDGKLSSMAGTVLRLDDFGPLMAGAIRAGDALVVADVTTDERSAAHVDAYAASGVRSCLAIPLMKEGRLRAILNLHDSCPHYWTGHEIALAQDMVDRTWFAVENARSQAELKTERDQSEYIFDSMTEGFAVLDSSWTVLRMNAEGLRITQRSAQEVIGKNHWDIWPELKGSKVEEIYRQVKETRKAGIIEMPYTFPDQSNGWVEVRTYPSLDGGLAFFFRDISERMRTQEKLQDADRRKDEFLAMLAHELRNPLAPIGAAAEVLQLGRLDEERVQQTSKVIGRQVDHMTGLINDLLDVSRVTRGLVELDNAPLDIRHIVADAVEQVTPLIQSRRHYFALHLPPDTTMVVGDKKRLVQVIVNILNNAARYTPEGGRIVLKVDVHAAEVAIEVEDNGIGMTPELTSRAFDLFAQGERDSDRSSGGLGLGLALVKSLTELHGGRVTCESAGLGKGSKFTLRLSRLVKESQQTDQQNAGRHLQQETKSLRIMVVDDNVDAAAMLGMLLEVSGHKVMIEHSSRKALERASKEPPQVCLLDIGLPEINGNELAQQLRAQPETARSLLIAVTGYGQEQDRMRTQAAGFDHHLVKPVDIKKLTAILAQGNSV